MPAFIRTSKLSVVLILTTALQINNSFAQGSDRDALITELVKTQAGQTGSSSFVPLANLMMQQAKQINPGTTPETWQAVQQEISNGMVNVLNGPGGPIDIVTHAGTVDMSNAEIAHLIVVLSDPTLAKFRSKASSSDTQTKIIRSTSLQASKMAALVNAALVHNGLREIH
jgi:hypothetical protein